MYYSPKTSTDGLVFHYDTGNTVRSYSGEPTTNLLPNGVAAVHDAASGNAVTVTDATTEKGPGWKKVTITARGSNFRTLQWTYLSMSANVTYTFSAVFDWGNMRGKNYFIYFDGNGTGARTYYRPGDYTNAGSELIDSTMPDGKFAGKILHSGTHTHSFFIGNSTTGVSGLNDYFYYKEFQAEAKSHPTQFTTGTRSATQGLKDLTARNNIDIGSVSFDSNAQMTFDGTDDFIPLGNLGTIGSAYAIECVFNSTSVTSYRNVFDMNYNTYSGVTGNTGPRLEQYTGQGINFIWSGVTNNNNLYNYTNIISISANRNYHVVFVQDGSTGKMYLDGTLRDSANNSQGYLQTFGDAAIGRGFTLDPSRYFSGGVYVFKIYKKALSADEVQRNFNAVKSRFNIA
jgi:hypothetical protein